MRVLVVGSGGREHALTWKLQRSVRSEELFVAPGNAGTPGQRCDLAVTDVEGIVACCLENEIELVVIGPESALEAGLADRLRNAGVAVFGPTRDAARLETSKSFARSVATELGIPSPRHATFSAAGPAVAWWRDGGFDVVVKQDGLAAGKGVVVPDGDEETEAAIVSLAALGTIVLEERLSGPECSLLALCDGRTARALPIAQDHKRIGEGDTGPNTGGMGAFAPAPVPYTADELVATFIQPVLDHLAAAGTPYVGVLYAGLMLTADGPRLIEYNCRFGDPEAQAVLPLVESDLLELMAACCEGRLADTEVAVTHGSACTVVAAAPGYPGEPVVGSTITFGPLGDAAIVFHAGTTSIGDEHGNAEFRTSGGRVLAVTGLGDDLDHARRAAYATLAEIRFDGMQVRRDIGWRAPGALLTSYAAAGVDIDEGNLAVARLQRSVDRTHSSAVLNGIGSFGGALDVSALKELAHPVLVASTDGVGTKVELAARSGRVEVCGRDIVNHCVDDVLVQAARPLFFLDYIAAATLDATLVAAVVEGMAAACEENGCVLLGGETAEMPGVYTEGSFDVAGTLVGVVDRAAMLPRPGIGVGDVLVGLASSGPHTNGYSLLRKLFAWISLEATPAPLTEPLGDALLRPHRSYLTVLDPVLSHAGLKGLAHITGGGLIENVPRILPDGIQALVQLGSWPVPPLFQLVEELATAMDTVELHRTLNMGIGMVLVCAAEAVDAIRGGIGEESWIIGELVAGERSTVLKAP